jgi:hypothetical protein
MEENTDMTRVQAVRFGEWIAENYEPCKANSWKKRFPKTSEEMSENFLTEEIYKLYLKK